MYHPPIIGEPKLFAKLAEIQGLVGSIEPDEAMEVQGRKTYRYISESRLLREVRPLLAERKIAALVSVDRQHSEMVETFNARGERRMVCRAEVTLSLTFADGETGERFVILGQGQGNDPADKAVYKAITSANRYLWWKAMLVGTDADDTAGQHGEDYYAPPQPAPSPAPAPAASAPKPTAAQKKLYDNLLTELGGMDPSREWEQIVTGWLLEQPWSAGRARTDLSRAEFDYLLRKVEAIRDKLQEQGVDASSFPPASDAEAGAALASEGMKTADEIPFGEGAPEGGSS